MKKFIASICLACLLTAPAIAQSFEEQFNQFRDNAQQDFSDFATRIDEDFAEFLQYAWEEFNMSDADKNDVKPKPKTIPSAKIGEPVADNKVIYEEKDAREGISFEKFDIPSRQSGKEFVEELTDISLTLFDERIKISYDPKLLSMETFIPEEEKFSEFWTSINTIDYYGILDELNRVKERYALNDYGYYRLVNHFSDEIFPADRVLSQSTSWFLLLKSGYRSRVAYNNEDVFLLFASPNQLFGVKYATIGGTRYYCFDELSGKIRSYEKDYPLATKGVDFTFRQPVNIPVREQTRKVTFNHLGKDYEFELKYNSNIVDYYNELPQVDLATYFASNTTTLFKESVYDNLYPVVSQMDKVEAVDFLLKFVQKGFGYKTDEEQFGYEKVFYPEDILHYPYSDCEDRSIFFQYLVRNLVGTDVIGLDYPRHVATAVYLGESLPGEYLTYQGRRFIVCDPTYINAPVGKAMEEFAADPPTVVSYFDVLETAAPPVVNQAQESVISRITGQGNIVVDRETAASGNLLVLTKIASTPDYALVNLDQNGQPVWTRKLSIPVDKYQDNNLAMFVLNQSGEITTRGFFTESEYYDSWGINTRNESFICAIDLNSSLNFGADFMEREAGSSMNFVAEIKKESDALVRNLCDPYLASIFAFLNMIELHGSVIEGETIQSAIDRYNPDFRKESSGIYKNIARLTMVRNDRGVIKFYSENERDVIFEKVKMEHAAEVKLTKYNNGNARIDVLSGISVGKAVIWFDLNYVKLFNRTGDLLFDYSDDHTQTTVNFKEDILD